MNTVTALVPMRHHSERVPGKNYRSFAGKPLYHHIVEALLACAAVGRVVIDTDSPIILEDAAQHFPQVTLLKRPEHLRDGATPMNDVLLNTIEQVPAEVYLQTHSTNPLLTTATIEAALTTYAANVPAYDSLFSVTPLYARLWDGLARPVNHNPAILLRTQDLPPIYEENSCLYVFTRDVLTTHRNRVGSRPYLFVMNPREAVDIDEELDFKLAEFLYQQRAGAS